MPAESKPTLIYRITHVRNVPWILEHGIHARTSKTQDPNFVEIGLTDLIQSRSEWLVAKSPGGTLADYVPFYFGVRSAMLYNIQTGYNVPKVAPSDIVYFVSSIERAVECGLDLVITDRHAKVIDARFFKPNDPEWRKRIDWPLIRSSDFKRDPRDPSKVERRAAECLVYRHLPLDTVHGIVCHSQDTTEAVTAEVTKCKLSTRVITKPDWYF